MGREGQGSSVFQNNAKDGIGDQEKGRGGELDNPGRDRVGDKP